METSHWLMFPVSRTRSCVITYFASTGRPAGEPFFTTTKLEAFRVPAILASWPSDAIVPSRSAMPAIPAAGSINPEVARFIFCTEIFACSGLSAASAELIGPPVPVSLIVPPVGRFAVIEKGNDELKEKFVTSTSTLLYTRCGWVESALETVSLPLFTFSLATERLVLPPDVFSLGVLGAVCSGEGFSLLGEVLGAFFSAEAASPWVGAVGFFPPRLEKFHFSPFSDLTRLICG